MLNVSPGSEGVTVPITVLCRYTTAVWYALNAASEIGVNVGGRTALNAVDPVSFSTRGAPAMMLPLIVALSICSWLSLALR